MHTQNGQKWRRWRPQRLFGWLRSYGRCSQCMASLSKCMVSDNDPQFRSAEFSKFCKVNGVKHICVSPYHPGSNGLAERFVQTFKGAMKKGVKDGLSFELNWASFLLSYRTIAHGTTDASPCMLLMGHSLRTRLDMLRPDTGAQVLEKPVQQLTAQCTRLWEEATYWPVCRPFGSIETMKHPKLGMAKRWSQLPTWL